MKHDIIDFHTHPFIFPCDNICAHKQSVKMDKDFTLELFNDLGVKTFCGSVVTSRSLQKGTTLEVLENNNQTAFELANYYKGAYYPGIHIHPDYVEFSIKAIDKAKSLGYNLIGELVPYFHGWSSYDSSALDEIVDYASEKGMVISLHTQDDKGLDNLVKRHKNAVIVGAHPGEFDGIDRHIERAKLSDNYYIDLSGTGVHRFGAIQTLINGFGAERVLYGSDYPTCNPNAFLYAVLNDKLIKDSDKELILYKNAKRILNIK